MSRSRARCALLCAAIGTQVTLACGGSTSNADAERGGAIGSGGAAGNSGTGAAGAGAAGNGASAGGSGPGERLVSYLGSSDYPDTFWQPAGYAEAHVDGALLEQALDAIQRNGWEVRSLLIARNGRLVLERYGWSTEPPESDVAGVAHQVVPSERQAIFSITKSIVGALVGSAIADGAVPGVDGKVAGWFPDYAMLSPSTDKDAMTLADLLTMRSGIPFTEGETEVFLEPRPAESLLSRALTTTPGTTWHYSSGDAQISSEILRRAVGQPPLDYAKQKLFGPLGIVDPPWDADAAGTNLGGFGLSLTARELARFGELYRNGGLWGNQQVVPAAWIATSLGFKCSTPWGMNYGYYWFLPALYDFVAAIGFNGQELFISKSYGLVIVFTGNVPSAEANSDYSQLISNYIVPAMQ